MASTTTATTLHTQFRPPSRPRAPRRIHKYPSSCCFSVRAAAASASAPAQREAAAGVPWGCEIESLESAASLERWLTNSGLPEQRLALEKVDVGERGLVALKNVRNGEKLLFVPPSLVITAESEWSNREVGEVMKRYSVPDWPLLATYLISEASLEGSSRWSSYIDALPRQPYSLLYWTRTEIDAYLVASPIRERAISRISDVIGTYNDLRDRIFSKHPNLFPEEVYNMETFKWSFGILFSRLVRLESMDGRVALVPWADMLNHSPEVDAFLDYDKSSQGIVFTTDRSYQPGEQVFISYGKKSSGELLLSYGFVPKEGTNPNDSVEFLVSLNKSDECYKEKLQALKRHGLLESESFPLRVTGWPVELMAYAFLVVSPPEMIQRFDEMAVAASNKGSSKPAVNYPELDEEALQFILDCCESSIKRYTKYLENTLPQPPPYSLLGPAPPVPATSGPPVVLVPSFAVLVPSDPGSHDGDGHTLEDLDSTGGESVERIDNGCVVGADGEKIRRGRKRWLYHRHPVASGEQGSSASMRAAGWRSDMQERMVAPLLVMTTC